MQTKSKHIDDLHFEHRAWKSQLMFNKDEVTTFNNRLGEISVRYTDNEILAKLEQLQNQYIRENEVIDTLLHDIDAHENHLVSEFKNNPVAIDHKRFADHSELRERMESYTKIYTELKQDLFRYLSKYM